MSRARRKKLGRTGSRAHHRRNKLNLAVYHLRPHLELLEPRLLLTTVTGVEPLPGTHTAPATTDISAVFVRSVNPAGGRKGSSLICAPSL